MFGVGSNLSACRLLPPCVLGYSRPASLGSAVVLAAGSEPLSSSPDEQTTPEAPRRDYCSWLSLAEHTSNYFSWTLFSLRGFSESLFLWLPLQPLFMREGRRRTPESLTFPGKNGGRNEGKSVVASRSPSRCRRSLPLPSAKQRTRLQ